MAFSVFNYAPIELHTSHGTELIDVPNPPYVQFPIIKSVIDMAEKLNIDVITEGVELVSQKDFLHKLGCDRVQGYLYDKPLPKEQFEARLTIGNYVDINDYKNKE